MRSHWTLNSDTGKVEIDWGKYGKLLNFQYHSILIISFIYVFLFYIAGKYELICNAATRVMTGSVKGEPAKWRKATFIRGLTVDESKSDLPSHDHAHEHVHDETCDHKH